MSGLRGWEWIIILLLALLLFGGFKKLPDAARGLGRSLRIFKAETKGLIDEDKPDAKPEDESSPPPPPPPPAQIQAGSSAAPVDAEQVPEPAKPDSAGSAT